MSGGDFLGGSLPERGSERPNLLHRGHDVVWWFDSQSESGVDWPLTESEEVGAALWVYSTNTHGESTARSVARVGLVI